MTQPLDPPTPALHAGPANRGAVTRLCPIPGWDEAARWANELVESGDVVAITEALRSENRRLRDFVRGDGLGDELVMAAVEWT